LATSVILTLAEKYQSRCRAYRSGNHIRSSKRNFFLVWNF